MIALPMQIRQCSRLLRKRALQSRQSSSTTAYKTVAPAIKLQQSYIHRPGIEPFSGDTLGTVLDKAAVDYGTREALVFRHQNIRKTWADVKVEADRLAVSLMQLGMEKGDRVGIWATNLYEWQLTQYAAAKAGLNLVNVNQAYQTHELEYCLKKVGVSTLVAAEGHSSSDYYSMLTHLLPELAEGEVNVPLKLRSETLPQLRNIISISQERKRGVLRFDDLLDSARESGEAEREKRQALIDCGDACNIQFTSGTTGLPKGATLSHHNIINNMLALGGRVGLDAGEQRVCVSVPLYHCFGCVAGSVMAPLYGNTLVFPSETFHAADSVKAAQDERCGWMYGTPTMFVDMVNLPTLAEHDISSLHSGVVAGAPVPYHLMEAMVTKLGLRDAVVAYGLTELSPLATTGFPTDDMEHRCGTVGFPTDNVELKVVDESGRIVPPGTPGELCSRGYNTFLGYWDDEKKTREMVTNDHWVYTGDIATMMEDGYVKIVGRSKDMVIRGGENVYPAEIEDFLHSHPNIVEAYVIGVPDQRMGEELCVWIRTNKPDVITEDDVRKFCKGEIAHYKIPRYIQFRDDFPKTVTGKIQKFAMRQRVAEELGINTADW